MNHNSSREIPNAQFNQLAAGNEAVLAADRLGSPVPADSRAQRSRKTPAAARAMFRLLERLEQGSLELQLPDGQRMVFGHGTPRANIRLANWNLFSLTLRSGDIGFAQSYLQGDWSSDSLVTVLELALANRRTLDKAIYGRWWGGLLTRLRHLMNRNTRAGSRRNIHAHYDLGNAFYSLWLDPSMTYSSALFGNDPTRTLEQAQQAKYQRILDELEPALRAGAQAEHASDNHPLASDASTGALAAHPAQTGSSPGKRASVLEIGCGWGGFAEAAARNGLQLRGLTLSTEQLAWARERIDRAGFTDQVDLALCDYRDERGRYDAIASIEMFEAVGEAYWPAYFQAISRALAPSGRAVVQTITIAEELFERYRRGSDFIQQYVFPGGMLPTVSAFEEQAQRAGLRVVTKLGFGHDYARTLQIWREAFVAQIDAVRAQGFDSRFERIWEFYLAYCEAGFRDRSIDVFQFTLEHARPA